MKMDNIMMGFEDPSVLNEYVESQAEQPKARKIIDGRHIYLSHNDFGELKSFNLVPKIADFGTATIRKPGVSFRQPIQAPAYMAPEVMLGTGWSYSADIWNLGVLVCVSLLLKNTSVF